MKKVISYIGAINEMDFQKDVILVPSYLAKHQSCDCEIYYGRSTSMNVLPSKFRNVRLICLNADADSFSFYVKLLWVVICNCKSMKWLMTFHLSTAMIVYTLLTKILNKKTKVWILGDMNLNIAEQLAEKRFVFSTGLKGFIKEKVINLFFNKLDVFSLETKKYVKMFEPIFKEKDWGCLQYFPCGWDEDNPFSKEISVGDKDNIFLSCARFGTYQKNTEMFLEALQNVELKNWKVYLVGPITTGFDLKTNDSFNRYLVNYFLKNPHLREKVVFTGPVYDTQKLFEYFQKAKVFVMTSRFEGFANVFSQARWNRCYIVSTDVGGACDMSDNWKYGQTVPQEDSSCLSNILNEIISTANNINYPNAAFSKEISYNRIITKMLTFNSYENN